MPGATLIEFNENEYVRAAAALRKAASLLESCLCHVPGAPCGPSGIAGRLASCRAQLRAAANQAACLSQSTLKAAEVLNGCETQMCEWAHIVSDQPAEEGKSGWDILGNFGDILSGVGLPYFNWWGTMLHPTVKNGVKLVASIMTDGLKTAAGTAQWAQDLIDMKAISIASSYICASTDNYAEWRDGLISGDRAVVETVVEGTVSFGIKTLIAAGVGMVLPVGAPALIVTAVTVWGADMIYKGLTGSTHTMAQDYGHAVGEAYDAGKKAVSSAVQSAVKTVGNIANDCMGKLTSGFNVLAGWAF